MSGTPRWLSACTYALGLAGALAFSARAAEPPPGQLREYWSPIDGSRQAYGVYLPRANPPTDQGFPVVMHGHGYGWSANPNFSRWQREWADDHGWVLVNVNGRGPNFYDGIGEDDVMRVLEDVERLVPVDRARVFITGGSMGGTGAYRMGVRRPDTFSAASPVDGWTDFRLFHKHWYERKDMPDTIEEFRRPLLEAVSALYVAGTARWADVQLITDGKDVVVWPSNGLRLTHALYGESVRSDDAYRHELIYNPDRGHGGGYDLRRVYGHFLSVCGLERPPSVTIQATLLRYADVHWAHTDRFHIQGAMGRLDAEVADSTVHVQTSNLDAFGLRLPDTPLATHAQAQVVADGIPCYEGPPQDVQFTSVRDEVDHIVGWTLADVATSGLSKHRGLEGPIGEAFLAPFVVVWGSAGDFTAARAARAEAEDFAREWNAFNVHYEAVKAKPEDELTDDELQTKNLIVFGTLDDSSILRRANDASELPIRQFADRVVVSDAVYGDRTYWGDKYGAYWVYPNPLTGFTTLVVGCRGRFVSMADGSRRRGLGYDLEKLQWGWADYVVFDQDTNDLPYCENVNNKADVLAYEAAYFVEAGFFDQDWRPDRDVELRRVRATRPDGSRVIHVDSVEPVWADPPAANGVRVHVVDEWGSPVPHARVTLTYDSTPSHTLSRPADREGIAFLAAPDTSGTARSLRARVVNVCATAATYAPADDRERETVVSPGDARQISLVLSPQHASAEEGGVVTLAATVDNHSARALDVAVTAGGGPGEFWPLTHEVAISAGGTGSARFTWDAGALPPGEYSLTFTAHAADRRAGSRSATATAVLSVVPVTRHDAKILRVAAPDRLFGEGYDVVAEIQNLDEAQAVSLTLSCVLVEARRYLPTQTVTVLPGGKAAIRWRAADGTPALQTGVHTAKVVVLDVPGAVGQASFVVK